MQGSTPPREENSGLLELKSLAQSAKRRHSQRVTSQVEAQESLLASTAALNAVALPNPNKEVSTPLPDVKGTGSVPAFDETIDAATESAKASRGIGIWLALGGVALAAAAAFFVLGGEKAGEQGARSGVATKVAPPVDSPAAQSGGESPGSQPTSARGLAEDLESDQESEGSLDALDEDDAIEPETAAAAVEKEPGGAPATSDGERAARKDKVRSEETRAKAREGKKAATRATSAGDEDKASEKKAAAEKPPEAEAGASAKEPSGDDIDDVLSAVTGGVDNQKTNKVEKKPTKTRLDRSDVAKAMGKVSGKAKACHAAEKFTGSVLVRFTVDPSGKIAKAKAKGAHASSATGKCVVAAVKGASFPAFSGRPTSFTFPFLLSE